MVLSCRFVQTNNTLSPRSDDLSRQLLREVDLPQRLLQVDDVDTVALGEDEPPHFRIPPARLVSEVDTSLQQIVEIRSHASNVTSCGLDDRARHRGVRPAMPKHRDAGTRRHGGWHECHPYGRVRDERQSVRAFEQIREQVGLGGRSLQ